MLLPHSSSSQSFSHLIIAISISLFLQIYTPSGFAVLSLQAGQQSWQERGSESAEGRRLYAEGRRLYASHTTDDLRKALASFAAARQLCAAVRDHDCEERSLALLMVVSDDLGERSQAESFAREALVVASAWGRMEGQARALTNLSVILTKNGKFGEAAATLERALEFRRQLRDPAGMAGDLLNLGILQNTLGQHASAQKSLESALVIYRQLRDKAGEEDVLAELATAFRLSGKNTEALTHIEEAIKLAAELNDPVAQAKGFLTRSYINRTLGKIQSAQDDLEHAAEIFRALRDPVNEAVALHGLGVNAERIGSYQKALEYYQRSVLLHGEGSQPEYLWRSYRGLGKSFWKLRQPDKARREYELAIATIEKMRAGAGNDRAKVSYFDTTQVVYRQFVEFLLEQKQDVEALEVAETGRARAFVDLLRSSQMNASLELSTAAKAAEIKQIAASLNSSILEYFATGTGLAIWLVNPDGKIFSKFVTFDTQDREPYGRAILVQALRENLGVDAWRVSRLRSGRSRRRDGNTVPDTPSSLPGRLSEVSRRAYQTLIPGEIEKQLPKQPGASLIIVPHEELFLVPFAVLEDQQGKVMLDRFTLSISPSITVLAETMKRHQTRNFTGRIRPAEVLIMGNPIMPEVDGVQLPALDSTKKEVDDIARQFGSRAVRDGHASEAAFKLAAGNKRVIHLATHGEANDESPMNSFVALSPTAGEDGLVTAAEVAELKLRSDLVVLSGCQTGLGRISGDGILGLSRSFMLAGADSLLVSLWKVNDQSTSELMKEFYTQLIAGKSKTAALRAAMQSARKLHDDPIHWAPFVLIGETR